MLLNEDTCREAAKEYSKEYSMGFLTPCQGIGACQRPEGALDESVTFLSILYKKNVIPAEAGIQNFRNLKHLWIPASAGMTLKGYTPGLSNAGVWDELRQMKNLDECEIYSCSFSGRCGPLVTWG